MKDIYDIKNILLQKNTSCTFQPNIPLHIDTTDRRLFADVASPVNTRKSDNIVGRLPTSDGTIPKFTSISMPIPIKYSILIPILDSPFQLQYFLGWTGAFLNNKGMTRAKLNKNINIKN